MTFTPNPNMLWNGKPLNNCSHDELVEAVTTLLGKLKNVREGLKPLKGESIFEDMGIK